MEANADKRLLYERIVDQIGEEFERLRWSAGIIRADFLHKASNAAVEGVKGFPFQDVHTAIHGAGNRYGGQVFDAEGHPRFREDPILDVTGAPIVNSAGEAFDVVMPASRQIFLEGKPEDIERLESVLNRAGTLLTKIDTEYDDLTHGWAFSGSAHYFWFMLFEIAWRGDHPLIEAKKQIWLPDQSNVQVPYDLDSLQRLSSAEFGMIAGKIPANWLKRLPDAWASSIDDAIPACQDAWSLFRTGMRLPGDAQIPGAAQQQNVVQKNTEPAASGTASSASEKANVKLARRFAVALSFPGQKRSFIKEVVGFLVPVLDQHRILYDEFYKVEFAVRSLDAYLPDLYRDESDLIVVFSSKEYGEREWCGLEYRAIRDLLKDNSRSPFSVLTLKFDDATLEGQYSIDGYLNIASMSSREVADCVMKRLLFCKNLGL